MFKQYALRRIGGAGSKIKYGITIPSIVVEKRLEIKYTIIQSGPDIILKSGTSHEVTKEEVKDFNLKTISL